jgi:signal transduction histidine kinase
MGEAVDDRKQAATATHQSVFELAHEIRNPLASIKGVADAFLQRSQLTRQEREWMEAVRREVSKIDARLRELLDISQPRVFHVKQCSLNDLISGVVLLVSHQVRSINDHHGRQSRLSLSTRRRNRFSCIWIRHASKMRSLIWC